MKKITFLILCVIFAASGFTQSKYAKAPLQVIPAKAIKNQFIATQVYNPVVSTKAAMEDVIGTTWYDMQTNGTIDTRVHIYSDGTIGNTWIRGTTNSSERGTGYNYHNGTAWGPIPTSRIEDDRTGWPSYAAWGPTGEIVIAHLNDGLKISKRDTKGTGTWNQSVFMGPTGATDISWPRIMTNGPNHNYVHMLVNTYVAYQGLDLAILYYRSLDGGLTWDKNGIVLPQMTSADYDGFNGDEIAWGTPHGDTIYFMISGPWVDTFIMKSYNNGETWTKIPILSNANKKLPSGTQYVAPFSASDGSCAVEMDNSGVFHAAFGIGGGFMDGGSAYIYVNRNGLVYWNSTMPMVKDSLDLDTLDAHGQLLGAVYDGPGPGDTIVAVPGYRVGLSSFPQITVDNQNNIYFIWSAATPGNPSPDPYNYRHIWGRAKFHDKTSMTEQVDLNGGVFYLFNEYVYPEMAKVLTGNDLNLHLIYQTAPEPGSNIVSSTIAAHECNIEHRVVPTSTFWPVSVNDKSQNKNEIGTVYPNPAKDQVNVNVMINQAAPVSLELTGIAGNTLIAENKGVIPAGASRLSLNVTGITEGLYFLTVKIGKEYFSQKVVIR